MLNVDPCLSALRTRAITACASALLLTASGSPAIAQHAESATSSCPGGLEVLIERGFASGRGIRVGDGLVVRATPTSPRCSAMVAGIFEPPPDPSRLTVERPRMIFHLPQLAELTGRADEVDQFTVRLDSTASPADVASDLERLLPGAQVLTTAEVAARASTTFEVVSRFHRAIGLITLVAGGVFLACVMVLKVQERRLPVAAARLIGIPRRTLLRWTVAEAAIVSAAGGTLGIGLGAIASATINAFYQRVYDTRLIFSSIDGALILQALSLALVLGLGAGVFAGVRLVSADPLYEVGR